MSREGMYSAIIAAIFESKYRSGSAKVDFARGDIVHFGAKLGVELPKNLGDLIYSFRYRAALPRAIRRTAKTGETWIIRLAGRGLYRFVLVPEVRITPNANMIAVKIPDATPGIIAKYALSDEQALLAKLRYNRLLDTFTCVTCYSLQNHLRTTVPEMGQVETDEIYVGVDKHGAHYVFPIQAKGGADKLGIVQIEQDLALCNRKFPNLICRPIAAQFMQGDTIALFEFGQDENGVGITFEKHYKLVPLDQLTEAELLSYRQSASS